jgi:hypothetical protein
VLALLRWSLAADLIGTAVVETMVIEGRRGGRAPVRALGCGISRPPAHSQGSVVGSGLASSARATSEVRRHEREVRGCLVVTCPSQAFEPPLRTCRFL